MDEMKGARPDARFADFAIVGNRMILSLLAMVYARRYKKLAPKQQAKRPAHFGSTLELMVVSMHLSVVTRDGKPATPTEIANKLLIPWSNVKRHLDHLTKNGAARRVNRRRYASDLDVLDNYMRSLAYLDDAIGLIEAALAELRVLRAALIHRMDP
jgi:DNA-binding MarR family transcriptional regulator